MSLRSILSPDFGLLRLMVGGRLVRQIVRSGSRLARHGFPAHSVVDRNADLRDLDETGFRERLHDPLEMLFEDSQQVAIGNVACRNQKKAGGGTLKQVGVQEIRILGDDDSALPPGKSTDFMVAGPVAALQIEGVNCGLAQFFEPNR